MKIPEMANLQLSSGLIVALIIGVAVSETEAFSEAQKRFLVGRMYTLQGNCQPRALDCRAEYTKLDQALKANQAVCTETNTYVNCFREKCTQAKKDATKLQLDTMADTCGACQLVQGAFLVILLAAVAHIFKQ